MHGIIVGYLGVAVGHLKTTVGLLRVFKGHLRINNWSWGKHNWATPQSKANLLSNIFTTITNKILSIKFSFLGKLKGPGVDNGSLKFQNSVFGQSADKLAGLRQISLYIQAISPMYVCFFTVHCWSLKSIYVKILSVKILFRKWTQVNSLIKVLLMSLFQVP